MQMYFSPSNVGFYVKEIHGTGMPADAVALTDAEYDAALKAQSEGQQIIAGAGGKPAFTGAVINASGADDMTQIRSERDSLLAASDWTQLADSPLTADQKSAWVTYRQSLRSLPDNLPAGTTFASVTWPVPPAS